MVSDKRIVHLLEGIYWKLTVHDDDGDTDDEQCLVGVRVLLEETGCFAFIPLPALVRLVTERGLWHCRG
jgi:hypothetical protein